MSRQPDAPLGRLLRGWRASRGLSQLDLALRAGFSARHVSFIENGRTQPSRQALLAIAEVLDVPLRDRNLLLDAGGFAHVYPQTPLGSNELAPVRGVLQFILDRHEPYGAVVLDRFGNRLMGNAASTRLLSAVTDPSLLTGTANLLRAVFHPLGARRFIVNWAEVGRHLLARAERELGACRDEPARDLLAELRGYAGDVERLRPEVPVRPADVLLPIHVKVGSLELRMFSTIMTLGTPQDVTLQELRIEAFFPADDASEACWRQSITGG
jgi:transcriptional regulator with XRE-family HTH domain